jgi:predicted metal-dependent hydrolase
LVARLDKIFNEVPPENHSAALAEFLEKDFRSTVKRMMKRYPDNNPLPLRTLSLKRQKAG